MSSGEIKISEKTQPGEGFARLSSAALLVGIIGLVLSVILGYFLGGHSLSRFLYGYLASFGYVLSIALGGLFFVMLQHVTRAGWSVAIRRMAENISTTLPVVGVLSIPIILSVLIGGGSLYKWAGASHHEEAAEVAREGAAPATTPTAAAAEAKAEPHEATASTEEHAEGGTPKNLALEEHEEHLFTIKSAYLNRGFFSFRIILYFVIWSGIALWYRRRSIDQDESGDLTLTNRMQAAAPVAIIIFALTLTLGAFDLFMSLDAAWYSTMFGVYYFAGCAISIFATLIIALTMLQNAGYLTQSLTNEHFHDLGKFLFAFVFFWGYIAFSQYMLIWYAAIPEEVGWYARRGASTIHEHVNGWSTLALVILFCHLLIPFVGLLSRHVKRNRKTLIFWCCWMMFFHWFDLYWIVMPEYLPTFSLGLVEILSFVGVVGIFIAALARVTSQNSLRPVADPRLADSIAFQNI